MNDQFRALARRVSPRHRRWQRTLASLSLDPDQLSLPVEEPGPNDFLICGCPRTGTALLSALLFQPPDSLVVMEPWDAMRLPPAELFRSLRTELATGVLTRGRLSLSSLRASGKVEWCSDGREPAPVTSGPSTLVGVKFPAFWRYLDLLPTTKFLVCVRNPADTLKSFVATGGRLAAGLDYDIPFNRAPNELLMERFDTGEDRRLGLYDLINSKVLEHVNRPEVHLVRYERWFTDPEGQMSEIGSFLGAELGPGPAHLRPAPSSTQDTMGSHTAPALGYGP